jgi:hypothetical protein
MNEARDPSAVNTGDNSTVTKTEDNGDEDQHA